jgi:hypothetical protein
MHGQACDAIAVKAQPAADILADSRAAALAQFDLARIESQCFGKVNLAQDLIGKQRVKKSIWPKPAVGNGNQQVFQRGRVETATCLQQCLVDAMLWHRETVVALQFRQFSIKHRASGQGNTPLALEKAIDVKPGSASARCIQP